MRDKTPEVSPVPTTVPLAQQRTLTHSYVTLCEYYTSTQKLKTQELTHAQFNLQETTKQGNTTLAAATRETDANLARLGAFLCGSPADGSPATMLTTVHAFVLAFDQSVHFIARQSLPDPKHAVS